MINPYLVKSRNNISREALTKEISSSESLLYARWNLQQYNPDCYDDKTEVLTDSGWKLFSDLDKTEKVVTLNPNTLHIEYQKPSAYIDEYYDGNMYAFKSKSVDLLVTPNHKFFVFERRDSKKCGFKTIESIFKLKAPDCVIPKHGKWIGEKINKVIIGNTEFEINDFVAFLGIYLAEGCCNNITNRVNVSQFKENVRVEIEKLLTRLNLKFCEHKGGFDINNPDLLEYCNFFGKYSWDRFVPLIIKNSQPQQISIFLDWFLIGDGTIHKGQRIYYTTSKILSDDIQELILKCGNNGKLNEKKIYNNNYGVIEGRAIISKRPLYEIIEKTSKFCHFYQPNKREKYIEKCKYSGKIYCLEVPNHIIYVRRHGKAIWSGNSLVGKKSLKIYQQMKIDDQVKACLSIKKFARISTPWDIRPGDDTNDKSVEMADFMRYVLRNLKGTFERNLLDILTAIEYGFSITEKVYGIYTEGKYKGKIGLTKLGSREPFGYEFQLDSHNNLLGIVFQGGGEENLGTPENPFPIEKFIIYSYNAEHGNPYGTSDLRSAYRSYWSKSLNIKWWNIFNERFGMPTAVFSYPANGKGLDSKAMAEIDNILSNLQAKSGFRIPDNIKATLLEATRKGPEGYSTAIDKYDLMISRSILVPSLLGFNQPESSGSYALGKKHFDVFLFVLEMLGRDIEETIVGEQIIKPLIKLNYGEVDEELMPYFKFDSLTDEDTEARARVIQILANSGMIDKREEWVREYLFLPNRDLTKYPYSEPREELPTFIPEEEEEKFQLSRTPNKFESKVDFEKLNIELNTIDKSLKSSLQDVVLKWKDDLLKKAIKIMDDKSILDVTKIKLRYLGDFKNVLRDYMVKTHLDSKLHSIEELQKTGFPVEIKRKFAFSNYALEPWEPLPPTEAIDFFNRKVICIIKYKDGKKKLLSIGTAKELVYYDKKAFAIAGIEQDYILKEAKMSMLNGIKNQTTKETMVTLGKIFDKYIDSGILKDDKLVTPSRLETIVRTNVSEAMNEGRMKMFNDPDIDSFVPYLMWSSILDGRTSDYCNSMDGKIFRKGEVAAPPAHFNALVEGANIKTIKGEKKIEDIVLGDLVLTHTNEYKSVYDTMNKFEDKEYLEIELENGKTIEITGEHPVYTERGWIRADKLLMSDDVVCFEDIEYE